MIRIVEVGPRDGLQNEKNILATEDKFKFISGLVDAGLKAIEVTSFVKAPAIPQMADAQELFSKVKSELGDQGVAFPCLVPNLKGYETAKKLAQMFVNNFEKYAEGVNDEILAAAPKA